MTDSIIIKNSKKNKLITLLSNIDKRKSYQLYIATCYFNLRSASNLIRDLVDKVKLENISIYIDKKEAFKIGKETIKQWLLNINKKTDIEINLFPVDTSYLFHSKAYSLVRINEDEEIEGVLVVGSANLTGAGLTSTQGNIEVLLGTSEPENILSFYNSMKGLNYQNIEDIDKFRSINSFDFKYSLLQSGYFVYKWSGSLNQELGIKFQLSDEGKQRIKGDPIIESLGFSLDHSTVSKSYFQFNYDSPLTEIVPNIKTNYGVETYFGHWVPTSIIDDIFGSEDFDKFKDTFLQALSDANDSILENIENDYERLLDLHLISESDKDPKDKFKERIKNLEQNDTKLWRIYYKYEVIYLPYDFSQRQEVEDLYGALTETCDMRKRDNYTTAAIKNSIKTRDLSPLTSMDI